MGGAERGRPGSTATVHARLIALSPADQSKVDLTTLPAVINKRRSTAVLLGLLAATALIGSSRPAAADDETTETPPSRPRSNWSSTSAARCGPGTSTAAAGSRSPSRRSTRWSTRCPDETQLGIRVLGATYPGKDKSSGCQDTQQIVPVGPVDRTAGQGRRRHPAPDRLHPGRAGPARGRPGPRHRRHHPPDRADHRRRGHLRPARPLRGGPGAGRPGHPPGGRHPRPGPRRQGPPAAALHRRARPAARTPPRRAPTS